MSSKPLEQARYDLNFLEQIVNDFRVTIDTLQQLMASGELDTISQDERVLLKSVVGKYYGN